MPQTYIHRVKEKEKKKEKKLDTTKIQDEKEQKSEFIHIKRYEKNEK